MTKPEAVKDAALQRIGCPYVMGGTGKTCTPQYREARMAQYPNYASKIRANCPRLKGSASSCANCKWCDPETKRGKPCYDCAQLALAAMKAADIPLVSGANSQWTKTAFECRGTIDELPKDRVCLVFRQDDDGLMHHVGVYLGDGTVVHARGHEFGVVRQELSTVKFTHYGVPSGLYDGGLPTVRRGNSGVYVKLMQDALNEHGAGIDADGKFGKLTEAAVKQFQTQNGLKSDGICGRKTWAALGVNAAPEMPEPEPDDGDSAEEPETAVVVERDVLVDILNQLEAATAQLEYYARMLNQASYKLRSVIAE
jgi:cell wall-associated NlpC family hydrolase